MSLITSFIKQALLTPIPYLGLIILLLIQHSDIGFRTYTTGKLAFWEVQHREVEQFISNNYLSRSLHSVQQEGINEDIPHCELLLVIVTAHRQSAYKHKANYVKQTLGKSVRCVVNIYV